jgi:hypothetical protein
MGRPRKHYPDYPEPLRTNLLVFKQRIRFNLECDEGISYFRYRNKWIKKKEKVKIPESRIKSIENKDDCVNELWMLDQYKKQQGRCAHPSCNHLLNNFTEIREPTLCWRSTSVNRINNEIGHTKDNCNLMHSYCNSSMERPYRGCYLFNCSRSKCSCKSDKKKVFEKIDHPENLDINKKRMFLIMESFYKIKIKK